MTSGFTWEDMDFWRSGEWQVIEEKLDDCDRDGISYYPDRTNLFAALDACPFKSVRVAIFGQDPYCSPDYATGIAFSIPKRARTFPPTLVNIFKEYNDDLHYPIPTTGSLEKWCERGVLLWNVIPTCGRSPLSHAGWIEWEWLTKEIIERVSGQGAVLAFLGGVARSYIKYANRDRSLTIETSHPSPRGSLNSNTPFNGSRLFTTINDRLRQLKMEPIDWRL